MNYLGIASYILNFSLDKLPSMYGWVLCEQVRCDWENLVGVKGTWVDIVELKQMGISHKFSCYKESEVNYVQILIASFEARVTH